MKVIARLDGCGSVPGASALRYAHIKEVEAFEITAAGKAKVTLKTGCTWGEIEASRISLQSERQKAYENTVRATVPGRKPGAADISHLTTGRFIVEVTENTGRKIYVGYKEPMRAKTTESVPDSATEEQSLEIEFHNESEFGPLEADI